MEYQFISPNQILLYEGCLGLVVSFTIIGICNQITYPQVCNEDKPIEELFKTLKIIESNELIIGLLILYCFISRIYNIIRLIINKKYTPSHKAVGDTLSAFIWECISYILDLIN